jgi:hypothetical protein
VVHIGLLLAEGADGGILAEAEKHFRDFCGDRVGQKSIVVSDEILWGNIELFLPSSTNSIKKLGRSATQSLLLDPRP